jgi:hypothetical protein
VDVSVTALICAIWFVVVVVVAAVVVVVAAAVVVVVAAAAAAAATVVVVVVVVAAVLCMLCLVFAMVFGWVVAQYICMRRQICSLFLLSNAPHAHAHTHAHTQHSRAYVHTLMRVCIT